MSKATAPTLTPPAPRPSLPVAVRWREGDGEEQCELTQLRNATPRSATLSLARQPELGQLLCLTLPNSLRPFGDGVQNNLWALVWAVTETRAEAGARPRHDVSVVFVCEDVPTGREEECAPLFAYLAEEDGRFRLQRMMADAKLGQQHDKRKESRVSIPVEVTLEMLNGDDAVTARELTVTENLSRGGAAVWTSLPAQEGQRVRLSSEPHGVGLTAVVRLRRAGPDGIVRLHLQFLYGRWPLERFN
jgi:hypothetical protein